MKTGENSSFYHDYFIQTTRWAQKRVNHASLTHRQKCWASSCRQTQFSRFPPHSQQRAESYTHDDRGGPAATYAAHKNACMHTYAHGTHTQWLATKVECINMIQWYIQGWVMLFIVVRLVVLVVSFLLFNRCWWVVVCWRSPDSLFCRSHQSSSPPFGAVVKTLAVPDHLLSSPHPVQ